MKINENTLKTDRNFNLASAALAFIVWSGWAYYINQDSGFTSSIVSAIAQGIASFVITLFMAHAVAYFFNRIKHRVLKLLMPPIITIGVTGSFLIFMHYVVGTHNIFHTISPALLVGFLYCIFMTLKLKAISMNKEKL